MEGCAMFTKRTRIQAMLAAAVLALGLAACDVDGEFDGGDPMGADVATQ